MYEYKGIVLEVLDYETVIINVDLGFGCSRIMYLSLRNVDSCLNDIVKIADSREDVEDYIKEKIKGSVIFFNSYPANKFDKSPYHTEYDIEVVYTDNMEAKFLMMEIKKEFCN